MEQLHGTSATGFDLLGVWSPLPGTSRMMRRPKQKLIYQGSKYPNTRYPPKTMATIPSIEIMNTVYLGTLDPTEVHVRHLDALGADLSPWLSGQLQITGSCSAAWPSCKNTFFQALTQFTPSSMDVAARSAMKDPLALAKLHCSC